MSVAFRAMVSGRVQGVGFRWATQRAAQGVGAAGWVRNMPDGRVEAWVEGTREQIAAMREFLGRGPLGARVDELRVDETAPRGTFDRFQIVTEPL